MKRPKSALKIINLKSGMPAVPLALSLLDDGLRSARSQQHATVKIIHGYGSSGAGGALRTALQAELAQQQRTGQIRAFIAGEDWRISDEQSWALLKRFPELKADSDLGRGNKGISIVVF